MNCLGLVAFCLSGNSFELEPSTSTKGFSIVTTNELSDISFAGIGFPKKLKITQMRDLEIEQWVEKGNNNSVMGKREKKP